MNTPLQNPKPNGVVQPSDDSSQSEPTLSAWRTPPGRFTLAGLLAGLVLLLVGAPAAHADRSPPGCTGSGLGISLFTSLPDVHIGDTIYYSVLVFNSPFPACNAGETNPAVAGAIQAFVVTPDGVTNNLTLRRTFLAPGDSDYYTNVVSYVVRAQDVRPDGTVRATASDQGDIHQNDTNSHGGGNQGVNTQVNMPCVQITAQCVSSVGENGAITFTGTVTNCGNNTLVGVTVTNFNDNGSFTVLFPTNLAIGQIAPFSGSWIPLNPCVPSTATLTVRATDEFTATPRTVTNFTTITCQNTLTPGIKVTKECPAQPVSPGQLLTFSGSVSNTGNVTLTNIVVVNSQPSPNTPVFTRSTLAPGEVVSFNGSYTAPTNCSVADTLTATAASRCGVGVSSVASATCPILTTPQIAVEVLCPVTPAVSGGTLTYTGTVRNVGDITLTNIVVVGDRPAPNTTVFTVASLAPGASRNFTGSVTVPANACSVTTTFSGRGKDICTPNVVTNAVSTTCQITTAPAIAVTLACPTAPVATGGLITYTGTVRNSGNVTLNNVTVVNSQSVPSNVLTVPSLAPGASTNFTASFTAPADACSVSSTVTASGSDDCTGTVNNSASATCTLVTTPRITVTQSCPPAPPALGSVLTYSGTVSNAGNITLTNITVLADRPAANTVVFTLASLPPGGTADFTGSYTVPANINACSINHTLVVNAKDQCTGQTVTANSPSSCPILTAPRVTVTKVCPANPVVPGALLTYSGSVTNLGNITLTNLIVVSDHPAPGTVVFSRASLAPGASASFTAGYTAPTNACSVTDTLTVTARDLCGENVATDSTTTTCPLATTPQIVVTQACPTEPVAPGASLAYTGTVRNAGNITLTNVTVVTDHPSPNTLVFTVAALAPGATANFTNSYTAPVDACTASNTLTASAQDQCAGRQVANSVSTTCPLATAPAISITKICPPQPAMPGGPLNYGGTVLNTGNITLTNISVVCDRPAANTVVFTLARLAPGASADFTGSYTVPASLNACSITDTLKATGKDQCSTQVVTAQTTTTCPVGSAPKIKVVKSCPASSVSPGGLLAYSGTVSNPGTITLTNVTVVSDQPVPNTVVFTVASLAPGAAANFTGNYTAPLNACSSTSTLQASARDVCGNTATDSTTTTCPLVTSPHLAVTKGCPPEAVAPGSELLFSGTVTNIGNITLTNVVVVHSQPTAGTHVFGPITLAPGEGTGFTGSFLVPTNINSCSISSTLSATANDACTGSNVTASATGNCPILTEPGIMVTKECPLNPVAQGALLTFRGMVMNTGNITLTNVVVLNSQPVPDTVVFRVGTLAPGQATNFPGSYTVPPNCCSVIDTLLATGADVCTGSNVTDTATSVCPVLFSPRIKVTKVCPAEPVALGEKLTFSGTISNAGNITLVEVLVFNDQVGNEKSVLGPISLAPGETVPYTGNYVVPLDFCGTDTVTARAASLCGGADTTDSVTSTCAIKTSPALVVVKHCPPTAIVRCSPVTYTGTILNTGDVTLTGIMVYNSRPTNNTPVLGPITLAPGSGTNFTFTYTAPGTCDCCELVDTLTATGQDRCSGQQVVSTSTSVCPFVTTPAISVSLDCSNTSQGEGGWFAYSGLVKNTGDITLTNVTLVANLPNANTHILGPITLAPGETEDFLSGYTVVAGQQAVLLVTASGVDICQGKIVSANMNCSGTIDVPQPVLSPLVISTGTVTIAWTAVPGATYRVQYKSELTEASWQDLPGDVTATGNTASKSDGLDTKRFYRVLVVRRVAALSSTSSLPTGICSSVSPASRR